MDNNGGPAFPSERGRWPDGNWNQTYESGMTLRDWFAGQALAGLASAHDQKGLWQGATPEAAFEAYKLADAMLEARKRGE
jgi:hypothetical protein